MENNNGKGIFYGVIGVATLVVAIIGATFAYFSATVTSSGDNISGETNSNVAGNLTLTVTKMTFSNAQAASTNLVPAVLDASATTGINRALTAGCTNDGYTGCHVYKIVATSTADVTTAQLLLDLSVTATTKTNWKYVVYQGSDSAASAITTNATSLATDASDVNIHTGTGTPGLTANTPATYYLMVYLENVDSSQNDGTTTGTTSETGSYSGTIELQAANGGQVKASFAA